MSSCLHQHGRRAAEAENHRWGHILNLDSYGDSLGKANQLKGWIHIRQQEFACTAIILGDAPTNAFHLAHKGVAGIAHQGDGGLIPRSDPADPGLTEVGIDPETVSVHQGQGWLICHRLAATLQVEVGDKPIDRGHERW